MHLKKLSLLTIITLSITTNSIAGESLDKLRKYLAADNIGADKILIEQEMYSSEIADTYVFIAYKDKNKKEVKVEGNHTGGTKFNEKTCKTKLKYDKYKSDADKNKKPYFVVGFDGLSSKYTKDDRLIEHRIYCSKNGKNSKIELVLQTSSGKVINEISWKDAMSGKVLSKKATKTQVSQSVSQSVNSLYDCKNKAVEIQSLYDNGKYGEIQKIERKFSNSCKNDYNTHILIGTMHFHKTKNLVKAKNYFKKALKIDSSYTQAYLNLAAVEMQLGHYDEAIKLCDSQLKLNLTDESKFMFSYNAGLASFKKGAEERNIRKSNTLLESKKYLEAALILKPNYADTHFYLAMIYANKVMDNSKARKHFQSACENGMNKACGQVNLYK
jgi:Tfp pilus assembly protein PilF